MDIPRAIQPLLTQSVSLNAASRWHRTASEPLQPGSFPSRRPGLVALGRGQLEVPRLRAAPRGARSARRCPLRGHKSAPAARKPPSIPPFSLLPAPGRAPSPSPYLPLLQQPGHVRVVVVPNILLLGRPGPTLPLRLAGPGGRAEPQRQAQQGPASGRRHLVPELAAAGGRPRLLAGAGAGAARPGAAGGARGGEGGEGGARRGAGERAARGAGGHGGGQKGERPARRDMSVCGPAAGAVRDAAPGDTARAASEGPAVVLQTYGWAAPGQAACEVLPLHPFFKAG